MNRKAYAWVLGLTFVVMGVLGITSIDVQFADFLIGVGLIVGGLLFVADR